MVICQCGSAARSEPATDVIRLVRPAWSPLPSPSKSKFTPSSDLACSSGMSAPDRVAGAVGDEVSASSELWPKSVTVSTTRSPAAWARLIRSARSWLWKPFQPGPLSSSVPLPFTSMEKYARVDSPVMSNMGDCASVQ